MGSLRIKQIIALCIPNPYYRTQKNVNHCGGKRNECRVILPVIDNLHFARLVMWGLVDPEAVAPPHAETRPHGPCLGQIHWNKKRIEMPNRLLDAHGRTVSTCLETDGESAWHLSPSTSLTALPTFPSTNALPLLPFTISFCGILAPPALKILGTIGWP